MRGMRIEDDIDVHDEHAQVKHERKRNENKNGENEDNEH
jgi:hypothetical protein